MGPEAAAPRQSARAATRAEHTRVVEHVVGEMHDRLAEPLTLEGLARSAILSPFHFHRVFREVSGVPPRKFLTALRMQEAKRRLLTTTDRVTDVCFDVGYASLGTFTTQFTQLVGVGPRTLRRLADRYGDERLDELLAGASSRPGAGPPQVAGRIDGPPGFAGSALVGLFESRLPQARPAACSCAGVPGPFAVSDVPDGSYHVLACAFSRPQTICSILLAEPASTLVAVSPRPLVIRCARPTTQPRLVLRALRTTDPPLLLALPLLLRERAAEQRRTYAAN